MNENTNAVKIDTDSARDIRFAPVMVQATDTNAIKAAIFDRIEIIQRAQAEIQHLRAALAARKSDG